MERERKRVAGVVSQGRGWPEWCREGEAVVTHDGDTERRSCDFARGTCGRVRERVRA